MPITFQSTWPLLLLPLVVVLWWVRRRSLIEFAPRQVDVMVVLRAVAFVLVVLAMSQPVWQRQGSWLSVVYLLDVSRSVAPNAVNEAIGWIEGAADADDSGQQSFLAFGGNAVSTPTAGDLRAIRVADAASGDVVDRSRTDVGVALQRAVASMPSYHVPRIVLLTDGRDTAGDLEAAVEQLRVDGIRTYTRPIAGRPGAAAIIDAVAAPDTVTAGMPFPVRVDIVARRAFVGSLVALAGEEAIAVTDVELAAGTSSLRILPVIDEPGTRVVDLVLRGADGAVDQASGSMQTAVFVRPRPRVLYVEGRPETARYLRDALEDGGLEVDLRDPWQLPARAEALDGYEAVILSDVDPRLLTAPAMAALERYVRVLGGGLLVAGGESVYGEDGYTDTDVERAMPVWFKAEREPKDLALVIALDKSYSMVGDKMALAKEASKAAVRLLEDDQQFGLLAFDYHFYWPVPIQNAVDKNRIEERISAIEASSPTNIYPALQDVFVSMMAIDAEVKHVILLSDGKTYEDDYEGLLSEMAEAEITVSAVAVGDKADRELLGNIATWGKGRSYFIDDPTRVPEIFVDETQMAQGITLEEDDEVFPVVRKSVEALAGLELESAPSLLGYVRTMAKDRAEIVLDTEEDGDPVLARWQYGLGRGVFFAADVKNRWAASWLEWEGYGKFWTQLVRETMRQRAYLEPVFEVARGRSEAVVTLDLVDQAGRHRNGLRPEVAVDIGGRESRLSLPQVAPGRYLARIPLGAGEDARFSWGEGEAAIERRLLPLPDQESRFRPADVTLLRQVAVSTGARFDPGYEELFDADGQTVVRPLRLWPGLALTALLLYLANMLLRRVRVFREPEEA